ncbi:uncharacterized protein LOC129602778 [Paramacrobiotus metropolitanus]|uniref:uncharacterized protein LOC129602778 n=1 Tax=Paramacrobiotus metropolitanus TaxID=2943436 RepID=UPI00244600FD|nr:uncharacterized protein LOC129602778 [Paramacrobiotus metropolitanus]
MLSLTTLVVVFGIVPNALTTTVCRGMDSVADDCADDPNGLPLMKYSYECPNYPTGWEDQFEKIMHMYDYTNPDCSKSNVTVITPTTADSGSAVHATTYLLNYTCYRPVVPWVPKDLCTHKPVAVRCTPEKDCTCCKNIYREAYCQYHKYALSRFWDFCTIKDETHNGTPSGPTPSWIAAATNSSGDPYRPFDYALECPGPFPPEAFFNEFNKISVGRCSSRKFTEVGNASTAGKFQVRYTCRRPWAYCYQPSRGPDCVPENSCMCCKTLYSEVMCQYDMLSLSRFWKTCTPRYGEMTNLESIEIENSPTEQLSPYTSDWFMDYIRHGDEPHVSGDPYVDAGKPEPKLVIHPCCEPPLMLTVRRRNGLHRVLCGTRPEVIMPFKVMWHDWEKVYDVFDRLTAWTKYTLNRAMTVLDNCLNITDHAAVVTKEQCSRCKELEEVKKLYSLGYTVVE